MTAIRRGDEDQCRIYPANGYQEIHDPSGGLGRGDKHA